ncbi:aminopeptidase P family protein [Vampirovibrio chlorellavorus]|uniref:aminopeptidase P family protein n=1 Tax=Vampirovibrio chlorellavorus TaxID=758823 RepID=UPI0026EF5269|nr:aminopeptidase P family protein [Vampirovibrio chlorellavorus]
MGAGSQSLTTTKVKLQALRDAMTRHGLDAYLVPSVDEHINEYLPENKQRRAWISGFTGSAGDFVAGKTEAWVFADSRYYEQADSEVDTEQIHISKLGLEGYPSLTEAVKKMAGDARVFKLGFDPFTLTVLQFQSFQKAFKNTGIQLVPVAGNLIDPLWQEVPPAQRSKVFALPEALTGQSAADKIAAVQAKLKALKADLLPVTKLDQVAWLLNWRGQDIPYNPLFTAYALITPEAAHLFMDSRRVEPEALNALGGLVTCHPYPAYADTLKAFSAGKTVLIDPKHTTEGTWRLIQDGGGQIQEGEHPVELMKALKNPVEIAGMKAANLKASRGKIRAWAWLDTQLKAGTPVTEVDFQQAIERFYAEEAGFFGLSFNTIAGAGPNGSIVHYGTPNPHKRLEPGELFLIDSGCQFMGGTTDDTRTLLVGDTATPTQKLRYTEVLKAHINCAKQQFPKGTDGARLDGITRATLWQQGLDYGHGTGHGVGAFLNVHEGPNGIHKLAHKPLEPGMITSIEPGFYEPGWGGIRLENLYLTVQRSEDAQGQRWYGFESLTYIPFDSKLIDWGLLEPAQKEWLAQYYCDILSLLVHTLTPEEGQWLQTICQIPTAS